MTFSVTIPSKIEPLTMFAATESPLNIDSPTSGYAFGSIFPRWSCPYSSATKRIRCVQRRHMACVKSLPIKETWRYKTPSYIYTGAQSRICGDFEISAVSISVRLRTEDPRCTSQPDSVDYGARTYSTKTEFIGGRVADSESSPSAHSGVIFDIFSIIRVFPVSSLPSRSSITRVVQYRKG